jgi:hypothetical protein
MADEPSQSDAVQDLDDFEVDILEALIAGELKTEVVVGDGEFAKLAFDSLRDRIRPQSELAEIDARVAERSAERETPTDRKPDREELR